MRKVLSATLVLMTILTVVWLDIVAYANMNVRHIQEPDGNGKTPVEYGILRAYFAEKLETKPQEWNTTEELGITLGEKVEYAEKETHEILVVDQQKVLSWMTSIEPKPYAIKYEDNFYQIMFLWVTPELPEHLKQWQNPAGAGLVAGWVLTGVLLLERRKMRKVMLPEYNHLDMVVMNSLF